MTHGNRRIPPNHSCNLDPAPFLSNSILNPNTRGVFQLRFASSLPPGVTPAFSSVLVPKNPIPQFPTARFSDFASAPRWQRGIPGFHPLSTLPGPRVPDAPSAPPGPPQSLRYPCALVSTGQIGTLNTGSRRIYSCCILSARWGSD